MKLKLQVKKIVMILVVTHLSKCMAMASRAFFCDDKAIISKTMMMVVIVAEHTLAVIGDVF